MNFTEKVNLFIVTLEDQQVFIRQCDCPKQKCDNAPRGAECSVQTGGGVDCLAAVARHSSKSCFPGEVKCIHAKKHTHVHAPTAQIMVIAGKPTTFLQCNIQH